MQILQKRILKMSSDMISKEKKIKDTEKLYMNLRDVLSKQRDPQAMASLDKVQNALRERGDKLKVRNRTCSLSAFKENILLFTFVYLEYLLLMFALSFLFHF